jgi:hypothetical protein
LAINLDQHRIINVAPEHALNRFEIGPVPVCGDLPMFDSKIQKLITTCKQRYEVEKRRQGLPNAPG